MILWLELLYYVLYFGALDYNFQNWLDQEDIQIIL